MNRRLSLQFQLRLPEGMRERIKAAADKNDRSMNAEIVATLEEKYPPARNPIIEAAEIIDRRRKDDFSDADWSALPGEVKQNVVLMELMIASNGHDDHFPVGQHLVDANDQGRVASIFDEAIDDNPYPVDDERHIAWKIGFETNEDYARLVEQARSKSSE